MNMFCYQCQEASKGVGCTIKGVCGKTPEVAGIQDLLLFVTKGIAVYNRELRKVGKASTEADKYIVDALFTSITNANFDFDVIEGKVTKGLELKEKLGQSLELNNKLMSLLK